MRRRAGSVLVREHGRLSTGGCDRQTKRRRSRPVSRVLSRTIIPLESPSPATSSGLPGSAGGHPLPLAWRLPYLALLQVGFAVPPNVATGAVRSYRTVSPLPASLLTLRRSIFCCTFRRLTPPRRYLAPCPQEPGLSSPFREKCSDRPADSGAHHIGMHRTLQPGFGNLLQGSRPFAANSGASSSARAYASLRLPPVRRAASAAA
jgi:hypothetical protein